MGRIPDLLHRAGQFTAASGLSVAAADCAFIFRLILTLTGPASFMFVVSSNGEMSIPLKEPDLIVERAAMIRWLSLKFETAGGKLFLNHRLKILQQRSNGLGV